jgi:nucleotide-binding universal stress UspA family protein
MTPTERFAGDDLTAMTESVFSRVVVGVDGTEPGFEACRQAARLADPSVPIEVVAVVHVAEAARAGFDAARIADELALEAEKALDEAVRILGDRARKRFLDGYVMPSLLGEIARVDATMVAVGSHGHRRTTEILIGGVAGELLHVAPCSVLIARPASDPEGFPRSIVVGIDGSAPADAALAAAQQLARRLERPLRVVTALQGKNVDLAHVHLRTPFAEAIDAHPVEALVAASLTSDLVVVGSRGLHGLAALGSVSERVAHQAKCSVLVVRSRRSP